MYTEFAEIYDNVMTTLNYDDWYNFIKNILKEINFNGTDVMDLGCGTGEITLRFAKDGYKVMGVDLSSDMLRIADVKFKKENFNIPLVCQDMEELRLPVEVDLVVALFDTMNYLLTEESLEKTLENVYLHLPEGGYFIFDLVTRKLMDDLFCSGNYIEDREDIFINWEHYFDKENKIDRIYTTFFVKQKDNIYKRYEEIHDKRIYSIEEVEYAIKKVGFEFQKYQNSELAGERVFWVLKK
ncbi:MAG: hypothetical protein B6I28_04550 [Fusobacteriia bacterium 4572_132]|nr:MAG: hypothetical protein B6I28_04550 [Fusobacteriia bacterium 4572_132]